MTDRSIQLLAPTSRLSEGPRFSIRASTLTLDYDVEDDDGTTTWHSVAFEEVLDFEFRTAASCGEDDVLGPTVIRQRANSERRSAIVAAWEKSVGWQAWNQERGGGGRFSEYAIFFDDAGVLIVIAATCSVQS